MDIFVPRQGDHTNDTYARDYRSCIIHANYSYVGRYKKKYPLGYNVISDAKRIRML